MSRASTGGRALRVLHCPHDVGGQASCLAAAERGLGLDSRCVTLTPTSFGYAGAESLTRGGAHPLLVESSRFRLFVQAVRWADVVHFSFGSTIAPTNTATTPGPGGSVLRRSASRAYRTIGRAFWGRDLAALARRGKGIVVTFQGSDVRPTAGHPAGLDIDLGQDERKRALVGLWDRYADTMWAVNPDLLRHLPSRAEFLPYANFDIRAITPAPLAAGDRIRIAHAPTNRRIKGTQAVLEAVQRLQSEGAAVELDLIEGASNAETLQRVAAADVVLDQLRIGWYGGLAVEAMALGRPVIAFIDERDLALTPPAMQTALPVINSTEADIADCLRAFVGRSADERQALGIASRQFVERWHDPHHIAETTATAYERSLSRGGSRRS